MHRACAVQNREAGTLRTDRKRRVEKDGEGSGADTRERAREKKGTMHACAEEGRSDRCSERRLFNSCLKPVDADQTCSAPSRHCEAFADLSSAD